jgi:hypothetical protein
MEGRQQDMWGDTDSSESAILEIVQLIPHLKSKLVPRSMPARFP